MTPETAPREEILLDFATREGNLSPAMLAEFIATHPQHAAALIELAREINAFHSAPCAELSAEDIAAEDAALDAALSEATAAAPAVADPFAGKSPADFQRIAAAIGVPLSFFGRFKDRTIEVSSIPEGFVRRLADALSASVGTVRAALGQEPRFAASTQFKSDIRPSAPPKQSFEEAMEEADLPEDLREELRAA